MSRNGITLLVFVYLPCDGTRWLKRMRWIAAAKVVSISRKTSQTSHSWHGGWYKRVRDQEINWTQQGTPIHTAGPHQTSWLRTYDEILTSPRKINRWHDWTGIGQISDSCKGETLTCCHDECSLPFARFADFWVCTSVRTSTCTANLAIGCLKQFPAKYWCKTLMDSKQCFGLPSSNRRWKAGHLQKTLGCQQLANCGLWHTYKTVPVCNVGASLLDSQSPTALLKFQDGLGRWLSHLKHLKLNRPETQHSKANVPFQLCCD